MLETSDFVFIYMYLLLIFISISISYEGTKFLVYISYYGFVLVVGYWLLVISY